jgi:ubiquitin-protein ligase
MTELSLIQQEYAYDQKGEHQANIIVYLTITLTKTFLINIDFSEYPQRPLIDLPGNAKKIIDDPYTSLETLKNWDNNDPAHIVDILHELETELYSIKKIETQLQKISQEYQYSTLPENMTKIRVTLLTYGFKEYHIEIDLDPYPKVPHIRFLPPLRDLLRITPNELKSVQNWVEDESEPLNIIREIDWLVDKNSRINFELNLLNANYDDVEYNPLTTSLTVGMEGKMKTEDLVFEFKIDLPRDYPMSMPKIEVINEFEFDEQKAVKNELNESMADFFDEWTPYSYLVDLFNLISKKIFEVSVVSCVICHDIECPTCGLKIAGPDEDTCFISCPHCERSYHKHCWNQTMNAYGKCGFCLKTPPPSYMPQKKLN